MARPALQYCRHCKQGHRYTGFIYRWTNRTNGKWYVGSHYGCLEDGYVGSGSVFQRAVRTHGVDQFVRDVLFMSWCSRRELLDLEERMLIELDARTDRSSYNTKNKGLGQDPEVTRRVFLGRKQTEQHKARRHQTITENGTFKGEKNGRAREVVRLDTGETFAYARRAARAVDGHEVGVSEACNSGTIHRGVSWMFRDEWEALGRPGAHPRSTASRWKVVRLTDGRVFDTASEAGREHSVAPSAIAAACEAQHLSCSGHHWMHFDAWVESGQPIKVFTPYSRSAGEVVDLLTGQRFASASDCARAVGLSDVAVMRQVQGRTKARRFVFAQDQEAAQRPLAVIAPLRPKRAVRRIDTGEVFASISDAAKSVGGGASGLSAALASGRSYRGYFFEIDH